MKRERKSPLPQFGWHEPVAARDRHGASSWRPVSLSAPPGLSEMTARTQPSLSNPAPMRFETKQHPSAPPPGPTVSHAAASGRFARTSRSKVNQVAGGEVQRTGPEAVRPARLWLRGVFALLLLAAVFAGSGVATCAYRAIVPKPPELSSSHTELVPGTAVVTAIRDLAVLESASYHMERVIDLRDKQSHLFGLFESQDALLLVAAADVVAGVDLRTMRDGDISFDPVAHTARVLLPPPTILSSHLDGERTYVASRNTDAFARRSEALETRARQEAERTLREAAIDAGIMQRARSNAGATIKTLLGSLGFTQAEIAFREE